VGIGRGVAGAAVTVEVAAAGDAAGGTVCVAAAAVHHAAYAAGDRVLVLFTGAQAESAVVAGRVGELADAFAAANVLARLLEVDGAGSGLDADRLDGSEAAAFAPAEHTHAYLPLAGGTLSGALAVAAADAAVTRGAAFSATTRALSVGGARNAPGTDFAQLQFKNFDNTSGAADYVGAEIASQNDGGIDDGDLRFSTADGQALAERMVISSGGLVGIWGPGAAFAPQGVLHVHDGVGGFLCATRTAIGAAAQVLLPNGAGDVALLARVEALVSNGSQAAFAAFTLDAAAPTYSVAVGADAYQFRRNADGSLDVRRTAGSSAGTALVRALWM
jgi:hypothetical protein